MTRGTTNAVEFTSDPPGASVQTSLGFQCAATPCQFNVDRKAEFDAVFRMPGYVDQTIRVQTRVAGAGVAGFAGNVLVGGVVGMGVDAATGATLEHYPNPVHAVMAKVGKPPVDPKRKIPGKDARPPVS